MKIYCNVFTIMQYVVGMVSWHKLLLFKELIVYSGTSEQRTIWDQYKFKWFVPCIEVVLFKRFQSHYIDRGDKIWGFMFVHCGEVFNSVPLSEGRL